ncbi:alpha/beta-hydrolase family protein [Roseovarius mucosus]|uniref:Alpha/beta-hydrolase family protein n=1 Tax=Roseovarius mucosus TaxID=215743 RepID=A0A1V0RU99_9RHOB|nr:alpha/beta-hydrolase family protein [Roseovarius mucosus]ARE85351.1 alpha/beta-hydrolase family protein [Roseovarius mucosus]
MRDKENRPDGVIQLLPRLFGPLSPAGILVGAVLFAVSLTPSMVPRGPEIQGALGGLVFAIGYAAAYVVRSGVYWLGVQPAFRPSRVQIYAIYALALMICGFGLWMGTEWQNSIRVVWGLPELDGFATTFVVAIALAVAALLIFAGRLFELLAAKWYRRTARYLPPRVARGVGLLLALGIFWAVIDGIAFRFALRTIDTTSRIADLVIPPDLAPPTDADTPGSAASLIAWEDLGRWGRGYVISGPDRAEIAAFWEEPARQPIRVYVGLTASGTVEERAKLAFDELVRVGGFERKYLVIATPTGSGWLDPGAMNTLEYITRGDVATVAIQYSYLSSPMSVIIDPENGLAESRALFDLIYGHWTAQPPTNRPRLYLHGLSLGAFLSQETVPLLNMFGDPFHGALWTGSPFLSDMWRMVQDRRHPDSPAWRPKFGNGSLIRTANQDGGLERFEAPWGPIRLVFLQYGSDPIVFFDYSLAWRRPDWLRANRAPDLGPDMRWVPLVTMLQVGFDMAVAVGTLGYGHDYAARHYIPAWAETLEPAGWTPEIEARLIDHLRDLTPR